MAQETAAEKAAREAQEKAVTDAVTKAQAEAEEAREKALEEQQRAHEAELTALREEAEARRVADAKKIAEATSGSGEGQAASLDGDKAATSGYVLLADTMPVFNNGRNPDAGYTTAYRGQEVQLTKGRAQELIDAGAVADPDADDEPVEKRGAQTKAPK